MSKIKVTCEVETYDDPPTPKLVVRSHWNRKGWVVIKFETEPKKWVTATVLVRDIMAAIENCSNVPEH